MINTLTALGRLVADPRQATAQSGATCTNFTLACDTPYKDGNGDKLTNFYDVSAWGKLGDRCAAYLHKGERIVITGDLFVRRYTDRNGMERQSVKVNLSDFGFADNKGNQEGVQSTPQTQPKPQPYSAAYQSAAPAPAPAPAQPNAVVQPEEDELPF